MGVVASPLSTDSLRASAALLAEGLRSREAELCEAILLRVRQLAPDADRDRDLERVEAMRGTIRVAVGSWLSRVARADPGVVGLPSGAWENVRLAARHGLSLSATLQSYVTGHLVSWEFLVEEAERLELAEAERIALLKHVSLLETRYFNELISLVSECYLAERERTMRTREQRVAELVRALLDGGETGEADLGYPLDLEHLGLVVSGATADAVARRLAAELGRRILVVARSERTCWAWLGGSRPLEQRDLDMALDRAVAAEAIVSVGESATGVSGFRLTHRQAVAAHGVAQRSGAPVTRYADVALVAWGLDDDALGPAFVDLYLGPLGGAPRRAATLRDTLRAYFASGHNAASAAAALGVHERTITYRLRAIEEQLGCPLYVRRAELETALRLRELLGATGVQPAK